MRMKLGYRIVNWLTGNALVSMGEDIEDLGMTIDQMLLSATDSTLRLEQLGASVAELRARMDIASGGES